MINKSVLLRRLEVLPSLAFFAVLLVAGCEKSGSPVEPPVPPVDTSGARIRIAPDTAYGIAPGEVPFRIVRDGGDTSRLRYTWDFGDGTLPVTTADDSLRHLFMRPGRYWVTCGARRVRDSALVASDISLAIMYKNDIVHISFATDTAYGLPGEPVKFTINRQGGDASQLEYIWDFNDGSAPIHVSTDTMSHVFATIGTYRVSCKAAYKHSGLMADSAGCLVRIQSFDFPSMKKLRIRLQLPGTIHDIYTRYNGSGDSWTHDTTYEAVVDLWTGPKIWETDIDTIANLEWNGRQFSYSAEIFGMPHVTIALYGILSKDFTSITELGFSWTWLIGMTSNRLKEWSYQLSNIPIDPPSSATERTCHVSGTALQGRVSRVSWRYLQHEGAGMSDQEKTLVSWFVDDRASLSITFMR